jgi:regulator of vacuolar morphogenesis
MAPAIEISIPSATVNPNPKPHTVYNITVRLPLRSYTVQKRYSDFLEVNTSLTSVTGQAPPASLPAKSWFARTINNPELTEQRRQGLETYVQTINSSNDSRWRHNAVWRAFLNLPSSFSTTNSSKADTLHSFITGPTGANNAPISDPVLWLDVHRDLKTHLHDARLHLTTRDQASTPQKQHEAGAAAKSSLVKAGSILSALEGGLTQIQKSPQTKLGDGELRRRKDLIASARKDRDGLENLLSAMTQKSKLDSAVASVADKDSLLASSTTGTNTGGTATPAGRPKAGRVLGKETNETRELDNQGVVQLQKQKMADQDLDVEELRKIIQRQRELGTQIHEELEVQNDLLRMVDEDVDRVQGKIDVAKKRIGKIH